MLDITHSANLTVNGQHHDSGLPPAFASREGRGMTGPSSDLHRHLRAWRHALGLTLEQVAYAIGSKINTLSGWETGKRGVGLDDLKRLAESYGVEPAALLFAPPAVGEVSPERLKEGGPEFQRFMQAAALVGRMTPAAADAWLGLGHQLVPQGQNAVSSDFAGLSEGNQVARRQSRSDPPSVRGAERPLAPEEEAPKASGSLEAHVVRRSEGASPELRPRKRPLAAPPSVPARPIEINSDRSGGGGGGVGRSRLTETGVPFGTRRKPRPE